MESVDHRDDDANDGELKVAFQRRSARLAYAAAMLDRRLRTRVDSQLRPLFRPACVYVCTSPRPTQFPYRPLTAFPPSLPPHTPLASKKKEKKETLFFVRQGNAICT